MLLATLQQVKAYGGPDLQATTASDTVLNFLISTMSAKAQTYCGRNFAVTAYNEQRNGNGGQRMALRYGPVTSLTSIVVDTLTVPGPTTVDGSGWRQADLGSVGDGRQIVLEGYEFCKGLSNVAFSYSAGYANGVVSGELWNIPSTPGPYTITLAQASLYVGGDSIVHTSGGAPFTRVAGNPATGQYSISSAGVCTFNAADQGVGITVGYQTLGIPPDLNEAVVELVYLRYKQKDWTGYSSKSLAGETVSFLTADLPNTIKGTFDAYRTPWVPL